MPRIYIQDRQELPPLHTTSHPVYATCLFITHEFEDPILTRHHSVAICRRWVGVLIDSLVVVLARRVEHGLGSGRGREGPFEGSG